MNAPVSAPARTILTPLSVANADLLGELLVGGHQTLVALAGLIGRDPANVRKSLKAMEAERLVETIDNALFPTVTALGRAALAAIDAANRAGEARPGARMVAFRQLRKNPLNPRELFEGIEGLADAIAEKGVLSNLTSDPESAEHLFVLQDGDRRFLAIRHLIDTGRADEGFLVPVVEAERQAGDSALIALIANTGEKLTPWEEAKAFASVAADKGWSAREVARRTGRAPAAAETGVRDVQEKIKVAKEARPEDIAKHELWCREPHRFALADPTPTWEWLRGTVRKEAPARIGPEHLNPAWAGERERRAAGEGGASSPHRPKSEQTDIEDFAPRPLTPSQTLKLAELALKVQVEPLAKEPGCIRIGAFWLDLDAIELRDRQLVTMCGSGEGWIGSLTDAGRQWLMAADLMKDDGLMLAHLLDDLRIAAGKEPGNGLTTRWLEPPAKAEAPSGAASNSYLAETVKMSTDGVAFRRPSGPAIWNIVGPGSLVETSYGTGPYVVTDLTGPWPHQLNGEEYQSWSLTMAPPGKIVEGKRPPQGDHFVSDLVAVDGKLLQLFENNDDQVAVIGHDEALAERIREAQAFRDAQEPARDSFARQVAEVAREARAAPQPALPDITPGEQERMDRYDALELITDEVGARFDSWAKREAVVGKPSWWLADQAVLALARGDGATLLAYMAALRARRSSPQTADGDFAQALHRAGVDLKAIRSRLQADGPEFEAAHEDLGDDSSPGASEEPAALIEIRTGDVLHKGTDATSFRVLSREADRPRQYGGQLEPVLRVQTLRHGRDYGSPVTLPLGDVVGFAKT